MACCHCMCLLRAVLKGRGKVTDSSSNAQPHRCKGSAQLSMCRCPGPPGLSLGINPTAKSQQLPQCLCPSMVPGCVATDPSCYFQTRMCWSPPRHFLMCYFHDKNEAAAEWIMYLVNTCLRSSALQKWFCRSQGKGLQRLKHSHGCLQV